MTLVTASDLAGPKGVMTGRRAEAIAGVDIPAVKPFVAILAALVGIVLSPARVPGSQRVLPTLFAQPWSGVNLCHAPTVFRPPGVGHPMSEWAPARAMPGAMVVGHVTGAAQGHPVRRIKREFGASAAAEPMRSVKTAHLFATLASAARTADYGKPPRPVGLLLCCERWKLNDVPVAHHAKVNSHHAHVKGEGSP